MDEQLREKAQTIASLMAQMANENRLLILCALLDGPRTVGELGESVPNITARRMVLHGRFPYLSFPRRYLWAQCTWRERQHVSLMLAVARIPMPLGSFTGCISQIWWAGRSIRLATYQGARVERWSGQGAVIRQGRLRLAVDVLAREDRELRAPARGSMSRTIHESLYAAVRFRLWEGERLLFDHTDGEASFEYSDLRAERP